MFVKTTIGLILAVVISIFTLSLPRRAAYEVGQPPTGVPITAANATNVAAVRKLGDGVLERVAFSPDGNYFATCGIGGVALFDGINFARKPGDIPGVVSCTSITFSPDSKYFYSTCGDLVEKHDTATATLQETFPGGVKFPHDSAMSPDGTTLITAGSDGRLSIWDLHDEAKGKRLRTTVKVAEGVMWSVVFDGDSTAFFGANEDGNLYVLDAQDGRLLGRIPVEEGPLWALALSPDRTLLAVSGQSGTVTVFERGTRRQLWKVRSSLIESKGIRALTFDARGQLLIAGSPNGVLSSWNVVTRAETIRATETVSIRYLAVSPRIDVPPTLYAATPYRWVVYALPTLTYTGSFGNPTANVYAGAFVPTAPNELVGAYEDGLLRRWDIQVEQVVALYRGMPGPAYGAAVSPDGQLVAGSGRDGTVVLWDRIGNGEPKSTDYYPAVLRHVAFSPDGAYLAASGGDGTVIVWPIQSGSLLRSARTILKGHTGPVTTVVFSPDGTRLLTAANDNTARIWDFKNGRTASVFTHVNLEVSSAAYNADGSMIVTTSKGSEAYTWSVKTGEALRTYNTPILGLSSAAFSADNSLLVIAGNDTMLLFVDVVTGTVLASPEAHRQEIVHMQFNPDGSRLLTASYEGVMRVWRVVGKDESPNDKEDAPVG